MSYDVEVADESFNYTSNMRQLFKTFDAYPPDWDGQKASEVRKAITYAVLMIVVQPESRLAAYDMPGGWGTWPTALKFLMEVRDACRANPDAIVQVSA